MTPKQLLITIICCISALTYGQDSATHLMGTVNINLPENQLKASYQLTNIKVNNPKMSFLLNEEFDVDQVYLNGEPIASSKNGRFCASCKVHTIWIDRAITPQDTVTIDLTGSYETYSKKDLKADLDDKIVKGPDVFIAKERSKWYPVIMDTVPEKAREQQRQKYTFSLKVNCRTYNAISIDSAAPMSSGSVFTSNVATDHITLTAENLDHAPGSAEAMETTSGQLVSHMSRER